MEESEKDKEIKSEFTMPLELEEIQEAISAANVVESMEELDETAKCQDKERLSDHDILKLSADYADVTMKLGNGGPFGAAIVKDGKVISLTSNSVLKDHDPTAHAEVNAIREAGRLLGTHDLSGCELYASGYPCPLCMSATIWANIRKIHVSGLAEDAAMIGFRDEFMYDYLKGDVDDSEDPLIDIEYHDRSIAQKLYKNYAEQNGVLY